MSECAMVERSARGYCPGEEGHAEEICGLYEDDPTVICTVVDGEPVFEYVETTTTTTVAVTVEADAPTELPFTGLVDWLLPAALLMVAIGAGLLRLTKWRP